MKKNIGILYDNISGNTGDVAIGFSLKKILRQLNVNFQELVPGNYDPYMYDTIIIGGGHLLRKETNFFYDKFKIHGNHILNSMGIVDYPKDLNYLNQYRYVTFRSTGDKNKVNYLKKESLVVPCTTMLLEDIKDLNIIDNNKSIGIHLMPNLFSKEEEKMFISWASKLPYNIYFIPITHYNSDYDYMYEISMKIKNSIILPIMTPMEIFTVMGRLKYLITCSLHGAIFSYTHNTPFILMEQEKSRFFLEDRGLEKNLFNSIEDIIRLSENILNNVPDYSNLIIKDKNTLKQHIINIKDNLPKNSISVNKSSEKDDYILQQNQRIHLFQSKINKMYSKNYHLKRDILNLKNEFNNQNKKLSKLKMLNEKYNKQIDKIYKSRGWKLLLKFYAIDRKLNNIKKKLFLLNKKI